MLWIHVVLSTSIRRLYNVATLYRSLIDVEKKSYVYESISLQEPIHVSIIEIVLQSYRVMNHDEAQIFALNNSFLYLTHAQTVPLIYFLRQGQNFKIPGWKKLSLQIKIQIKKCNSLITYLVAQTQVVYILKQPEGVKSRYICDYQYLRQCLVGSNTKILHLRDSHHAWGVPLY